MTTTPARGWKTFARRSWRSISRDDLINPPELGILEREIHRVKNGRAILMPLSDETVGHGTHTKAVVWKRIPRDSSWRSLGR